MEIEDRRDPARRREYRQVHPAMAHSFELLIALLSVQAGIVYFASPHDRVRSAVGQLLFPWDALWNGLYVLGGLAIVAGLVLKRTRLELAGLWLFAAAVGVAIVAIVVVAGAAAASALAVYVAALAACLVRIWTLERSR